MSQQAQTMALQLAGELSAMQKNGRSVKKLAFTVNYETVENTINFNKEGEDDIGKFKQIKEVRPRFTVEMEFEDSGVIENEG